MCIFAAVKCECSSVGRASASQAEGRGFEPRYSLKGLDLFKGERGCEAALFLSLIPWL